MNWKKFFDHLATLIGVTGFCIIVYSLVYSLVFMT